MVGVLTNPVSENYFNNGLHQNAYFLYKLLEKIPAVNPILVYPGALLGPDAPDTTQIFDVTAHRISKFETEYHCCWSVRLLMGDTSSYLKTRGLRWQQSSMATGMLWTWRPQYLVTS